LSLALQARSPTVAGSSEWEVLWGRGFVGGAPSPLAHCGCNSGSGSFCGVEGLSVVLLARSPTVAAIPDRGVFVGSRVCGWCSEPARPLWLGVRIGECFSGLGVCRWRSKPARPLWLRFGVGKFLWRSRVCRLRSKPARMLWLGIRIGEFSGVGGLSVALRARSYTVVETSDRGVLRGRGFFGLP
jgi:hypothetical protein